MSEQRNREIYRNDTVKHYIEVFVIWRQLTRHLIQSTEMNELIKISNPDSSRVQHLSPDDPSWCVMLDWLVIYFVQGRIP